MAKFNVYILGSHRPRVVEIQSYFIKRISNRESIKVYFLATSDTNGDIDPLYNKYSNELKDNGIDSEVVKFSGGINYMQKINYAQTQDSEYSVKMDEDLWFNENVWDYIIDNIDILDDPNNLLISPLLSNGIPTCDYFVNDFMTNHERDEINKLILGTRLNKYWGVDYNSLNDATIRATSWDSEYFYMLVSRIDHHYKGIHPVRVNFELNKRINDFTIRSYDKFCDVRQSDMTMQIDCKPYLCNSIFFIKTDRWREIVNNESLYRDSFDEVPLNLYCDNNNLNFVFVRNGYGIHTLYNTVQQPGYEHDLVGHYLDLTRQRNN